MKSKKAANKPQQETPQKEVEIAAPQVSVFDKYGIKIALGIISLIAFICFKDFILHQKIYLFKDIGSDSLNASWPFNMGMGQNILSFSFYDPFDYILYLFGKNNMPSLIIYKELVKILLAGF